MSADSAMAEEPAVSSRFSWPSIMSTVARTVLGLVLLIAGGLKVAHPDQLVLATRAYHLVPYEIAKIVGHTLPAIEMLVGLLLVVGLFTRVAGLIGAGIMAVFIVAIASAWARGLSLDCGCFGGGGTVAEGHTHYLSEILRDAGLLLCGVWLAIRPRSLASVDAWLFRPVSLPRNLH